MDQSGSKLVYMGKQTKLHTVDPNTKYFNLYTQAPTIQTNAHSGEQTLKKTSANTTSYTHRRRKQAYVQRSGHKKKKTISTRTSIHKNAQASIPIYPCIHAHTHTRLHPGIRPRTHTYMQIDYNNKWPYTYKFTENYKLIRVPAHLQP